MRTSIETDVVVLGEKVFLGQMRKDLIPTYRRWVNQLDVATKIGAISRESFPMTDQDEEQWLKAIRSNKSIAVLGVYERASGAPVGYASLAGLGSTHRGAEFGIAIGERSVRGRGYGTEATILAVDYGFTILGLHYIWLNCASINLAALKAYKRAGFRESGRIREAGELGGRRYDAVLMDILASEFESPVLKAKLGLANEPETR